MLNDLSMPLAPVHFRDPVQGPPVQRECVAIVSETEMIVGECMGIVYQCLDFTFFGVAQCPNVPASGLLFNGLVANCAH